MAASEAFPVGAIFIAVVSTDPNTLLGYGTWSQIGGGRVLVGQTGGDADFDTAEETGGEKTHTLTTDEVPSHGHSVTDPGHTHDVASQSDSTPDAGTGSLASEDASNLTITDGALSATTGISVGNTGGGSAHNNMPPYLVTYIWKRTA